ncbi:MAG: hypothetical protein QOE75_325 [Solirubrobacterales bacterium]|jgi:hypothetical protein|nr:hypothetical protein [Solirubrobacterales bacterium]
MGGVRKGALLALGVAILTTLVVAGMAGAAKVDNKPVKVRVGDIELIGNGIFTPSALPRNELAPIALTISGAVRSISGGHPPPLKELLVETDKNGTVEVKGYPECTSGQLQSRDTKAAKAVCKSAIIGEGTTKVEIEFPDSVPVKVDSELLMFNGGVKGGTTTLFVHAYITLPVPAAIVTTVKIKKINKGRYGLLSVATVPRIAGGSGSVTDFSLKIDKKFTYKGKKVSVLNLKCPDGKVQVHATAVFADPQKTKASLEFARPCTPKG